MLRDPAILTKTALAAPTIPVCSGALGSWRVTVGRTPVPPGVLAGHYDRKAKGWHGLINRHRFGDAYAYLLGQGMAHAGHPGDAENLRVLDAGIGTGAMSLAFARHRARRVTLDGVDLSRDMLVEAERHLGHLDVDLRLRQANLTALPYRDGTFDVVLAAHVIEHLPQPTEALAEIMRVLKPGGILICSITRASLLGAYIQLLWRTHRVTPATAKGWLRECGLTSVRVVPFPQGSTARRFSLGYVARKPRSIVVSD